MTDDQKERGRALGAEIRRLRNGRPASALATSRGVNLDTWRRVEQGRIYSPGFFLVADIAEALHVSLEELATAARRSSDTRADS